VILVTNKKGIAGTSVLRAMGLSREGLADLPEVGLANEAAAEALKRLIARARQSGFKLSVASGYRDYGRQLAIFNAKMRGERPVYGDTGLAITRQTLSSAQWLHAILRYSALPGTSRHHWGTDFDIWDPTAPPTGYELQLHPSEYSEGGPFEPLTDWLTSLISKDDAEGFYRPYTGEVGGVAPEPWHLSHRPSARGFQSLVDSAPLIEVWSDRLGNLRDSVKLEALEGLEEVEPQFDAIMARYVRSYWV
jgi:LAS superfamily LD-carboxypeptidase LdcB